MPSEGERPCPTGAFPRRRAGWTLADQIASSASSLLLVVAVAHTSSVETFGAFALSYVLYGVCVGLLRAGGGDVLLVRAQAHDHDLAADCGRLLGLSLIIGAAGGALMVAASVVAPVPMRDSLRAIGAVLAVLLVADQLRYGLLAAGRPARAFAADVLWLGLQVGAFAILLGGSVARPASAWVLAWAAAGGVTGAFALWSLGARVRVADAGRWVSGDRARVGSCAVNFILVTGAGYLSMYVIGVAAGLSAVAAISGAQLLFAPLDSLLTGVRAFALPALARAARKGRRTLLATARGFGLAAAAGAVVWAGLLLELPSGLGTEILGRTWLVAQPVLAAIAVAAVARTVSAPAIDGMLALGGGRLLVGVRALASVLVLSGAGAGAVLGGAQGAAVGLATSLLIGAALWWGALSYTALPPWRSRPESV